MFGLVFIVLVVVYLGVVVSCLVVVVVLLKFGMWLCGGKGNWVVFDDLRLFYIVVWSVVLFIVLLLCICVGLIVFLFGL